VHYCAELVEGAFGGGESGEVDHFVLGGLGRHFGVLVVGDVGCGEGSGCCEGWCDA